MGDFNEFFHLSEKLGGSDMVILSMISFLETMEEGGLMDLGFTSAPLGIMAKTPGQHPRKTRSMPCGCGMEGDICAD